MKQRKFDIGSSVYHVTPDSPWGIVLDCIYSIRHNEWTYLVSFGPDKASLEYMEEELSFNKSF